MDLKNFFLPPPHPWQKKKKKKKGKLEATSNQGLFAMVFK